MKMSKLITLVLFVSWSAFAGEQISLTIQSNKDIFAKLSSLSALKKDNYETSKDFQKRVCEETAKALGVSDIKSPIVIGGGPAHPYNADRQEFRFGVSGGNWYWAGSDYGDAYEWSTSFHPFDFTGMNIFEDNQYSTKTYSGSNAFGASKNVTISNKSAAVLYYPKKTEKSGMVSDIIILQSKPEEARRIANDLRFAVITRLEPPCFTYGHGHKPPTYDSPTEFFLSEIAIIGAPNPDWVVYLDSTKQILKRGKFQYYPLRRM